MAKIINIVYDLLQNDRHGSRIRQELENKILNGNLISHLRAFHAISQDGKLDETGSPFNIAKRIRNRLVHDDIDGVVVSFSAISLSGSASSPKLHFHNSFFVPNTDPANTEMVDLSAKDAYDETVKFVDECYRLIH